MARRWVAETWGSPERWSFVEFDVAAPLPNEVTIRVHAAGVNPADYKHVAAERPGVSFPVPIGYEVSGEISAVGSAVDAWRAGDEVVAFRVQGGYATHITVDAQKVLAKPVNLSHAEAANLLLAGATASEMLHVTGVRAGDTIVVHGASGAVGVSVLQQAALLGARVVGTASERSFERVRQFGGIPVTYGPGLVERVKDAAGDAVVAALDAIGTDEAVDASLALVADRSRIVTIVVPGRAKEDGFHAIGGAMPGSAAYRDAVRQTLVEWAGQGLLQVPVARTFALQDAVEALRFLAEGHPGGKLALLP
jgi:NADPH:quinone reductase-like Zn-dependent oxidoreductase